MIRLVPFAGLQVGVGQPYGTAMYGRIGYGIQSLPGSPQLQAAEFRELEDPELPHVYPLGTIAYGTSGVAQGALTIPVTGVRFVDDVVYSVEFIEDEDLGVESTTKMRLTDDGKLHTFDLGEL